MLRAAFTGERSTLALLHNVRRLSPPAPSKEWNPEVVPEPESDASPSINISVRLPEDAVLHTRAKVGSTLLSALEASDLSDVWPGGACGGACNCSTCRVVINVAPITLAAREDDELDMLEGELSSK